ncbi:MAG: class I SAM-dependent methyltransferase [Gemmatales bacterium]|nr:class I SAM-dependent methyltransferase [Gemmatales bacterium]
MLVEEARWFGRQLAHYSPAELSPMLNVGSQTLHFRRYVQPWIEQYVFAPLERRGVQVLHTDLRPGAGVDLVGDVTEESFLAQLRTYPFRAVFCSNLLEHVHEPRKLATHLVQILPANAWIFVSCPRVFPYHPDPIDNGLRPTLAQLARLFPHTELVAGEEVACGAIWEYVLARLRAWLRERRARQDGRLPQADQGGVTDLPAPTSPGAGLPWQQYARLALWLCRPVWATCAVLRVSHRSAHYLEARP